MEQRRSLFGPLLLIAAGVIWLLVKSNYIPSSNLWALTHIWPFLLIAAGVGLILRPYWSYTSIALDVLIIVGAILAILYAPRLGWDNPSMAYFGDGGDAFIGPSVRGSGNIVSETRKVSGFDDVSVDYPASVFISQGSTESVKVEADDDVLPGLKTEVSNNELRIFYKRDGEKRVTPTKTVVITITVKDLEAVNFSSAGDLTIEGIKSDDLDINLSGAGEIDLKDVTLNGLSVNLSGAGSMSASGTADDMSLNISGFGDFKAKELQSKTANVNISGAGSATVWAEDELDATISGAGSVNYYGSPSVTKNVNGVGSISRISD
jgi:hypothetical protein